MIDLQALARHAAAWRGSELFAREDFAVRLSSAEVDELERAGAACAKLPVESIDAARFDLPTLGPRLSTIQHALEHESGVCRLRDLPIDRWGEELTARIFFGLATHLGTAVSQSAKGERLLHVRDLGFGEDDPRMRGPLSRRRLRFHSDRCDVIAFLCQRQAESGGDNLVVSSARLCLEIAERRPDLLDALCEPYTYLRHTVDTGNERASCRLPVFSERDGHFAASLLRVLIERAEKAAAERPELDLVPMTAVQREALDFLDEIAESPDFHARFRQEPGDVLLLNNWVTFHRRDAFVDHADPAHKRDILRLWLSVPNSRPLVPAFADHFGAVEAGALRGGMAPA